MRTVTGIFQSRADAERAMTNLRGLGLPEADINLLTPNASIEQEVSEVPTTETEQPGMGKAMGGAVGGAMGAAGGATLGAVAASLLVPGVGPILAAGIIGAALFGTGGAAAGAAAGDALEDSVATGLPHDELFVYEDALRQGRSVVIASAATDEEGAAARNVLAEAGAESLDAARESWWIGLRDAEKEDYTGQSRDFETDERAYRRGFEAALHPSVRGSAYEEARDRLRARHGVEYDEDAFRYGYERGQRHHESLREKYGR